MPRLATPDFRDIALRKRRGRPSIDTVPVTARLPEKYIVALNAAIVREGDRHTRAQAIRFILRDWLTTHGFLEDTSDQRPSPLTNRRDWPPSVR